ncbi:MAG: flagellar motor switch phosphatase FliY [bacterium]
MSDKMSQEDIDRLLSGVGSPEANASSMGFEYLSEMEADVIGEVGNIFMGTAATTLSMLLGQKVDITTPKVKEFHLINEMFDSQEEQVAVEIQYRIGLEGTTLFALKTIDTAVIADLMMGGDGMITNSEVGELQLSAVGEAMNQMVGSGCTTLSSMLNMSIDITPPIVKLHTPGTDLDFSSDILGIPIIAICFRLKVGDLIDSELVQLMSLPACQNLVAKMTKTMNDVPDMPQPAAAPQPSPQSAPPPQQQPQYQQPQYQQQQYSSPPPQFIPPPPMPPQEPVRPVTVQPVQFASFDDMNDPYGESNKNLKLLMDVKLKLTVELGRTELPIKKVLELTRGSVIELDKIAGEPVELFANGKLIAKGEVVVIEDNFGLRITSIVSPDNRLKGM